MRACMLLKPQIMEALSQAMAQPHLASQNILAGLLWRLGFFDVENPQEDDSRRCWEFHDLLMHETSRFNRDLSGGGTYRYKKQFPSAPAIKATMSGERIELPVVDVLKVRNLSNSLDEIQSGRK